MDENNTEKSYHIVLSRLCAVNRDLIYIGTTPEGQELGTQFVGICKYDHSSWFFEAFNVELSDMSLFQSHKDYRTLLLLGEDGRLIDADTKVVEEVQDTVLKSRSDLRLGHVLRIRQIGDSLYVSGDGGQNYMRSADGIWTMLDPTLFDGPSRALELGRMMLRASGDPQAMTQYKEAARAERSTRLSGLAGIDQNTIYACSEKGQVFWFDGVSFQQSHFDENESFLDVLVESKNKVYICGRRGAFLCGNHMDGFKQISGRSTYPNFSRMTSFKGDIYIASYSNPRGLFVHRKGRIQRVRSALKPDIEDVNMIEATDGVLWVMGTKDLLRFDGTTWERIRFPANLSVR